jgi:hypothetical protein
LLFNDNSAVICKPVKLAATGEREVWLGGERLLYEVGGPKRVEVPVDPTDDFNRANESPLAGNWTRANGSAHNFQLISNEIAGFSVSDDGAYYWNAVTPPDDQWSEIAAGTVLGEDTYWGAACRCFTGIGFTMYIAAPSLVGEGGKKLMSVVDSNFTTIASITAANVVSGDVVRVEAQGSTIRYKQNGVEQTGSPVTNTSIASGRWGVYIYALSARLDNWQGGDFAVPGPSTVSMVSMFKRRRRC